jgi:hypothetical protein
MFFACYFRKMEFENVNIPAITFHRFMELPDHVIIKVMSYCNFKTKIALSESCSYINNLLWTSPKITKFMLNVKFADEEILTGLNRVQLNRRRYTTLTLNDYSCRLQPELKFKLREALQTIGKSVKELRLRLSTTDLKDLAEIIREFPRLEKLSLGGFVKANLLDTSTNFDTKFLLPYLKDLKVEFPNSNILKIVRDVNTLEKLSFHCYDSEYLKFGTKKLEKLLQQQNRLTKLEIKGLSRFPLFCHNKIDGINFKLESLQTIGSFLDRNTAVSFFEKQDNIKHLNLINFYDATIFPVDRSEYSIVLRAIFSLPKLEKLTLNEKSTISEEDFLYLSDIRNTSMKELEFWSENSKIFENLVGIFPNLTKLELASCDVRLSIASEKLRNLKMSSPSLLARFNYSPTTMDVSNDKFEENFVEFIKQHRYIRSLTIGHENWSGMLSLKCISLILDTLKDLCKIELFNPLQPVEVAQLMDTKKSMNEIFSSCLHF